MKRRACISHLFPSWFLITASMRKIHWSNILFCHSIFHRPHRSRFLLHSVSWQRIPRWKEFNKHRAAKILNIFIFCIIYEKFFKCFQPIHISKSDKIYSIIKKLFIYFFYQNHIFFRAIMIYGDVCRYSYLYLSLST